MIHFLHEHILFIVCLYFFRSKVQQTGYNVRCKDKNREIIRKKANNRNETPTTIAKRKKSGNESNIFCIFRNLATTTKTTALSTTLSTTITTNTTTKTGRDEVRATKLHENKVNAICSNCSPIET